MREKRAVCAVILLMLAVMLAVSILRVEAAADSRGQAAAVHILDDTLPDFIYNTDAISENSLAGTLRFSLSSSGRRDLPFLSRNAACIVRGRVENLYYTSFNGMAWTLVELRISESLKGGSRAGESLSLYLPGGYISAADYALHHGGEDGSPWQYYQVSVNGVPHLRAGDEALFFLCPASGSSCLPHGAWLSLNSGIFQLTPDGMSLICCGESMLFDNLSQRIRSYT